MKKLTAFLTALVMAIVMSLTACAGAEGADDLFAQMSGKLFEFTSGVGAWSTELVVKADGSFTGDYHDSEMGETGEGYPNGTVYGCVFHGQFSDLQSVDEYTRTAKITLEMDEGQVPETIEDGIRYVTSAACGLEKAQTVTIFLPGTPVDRLPEGFIPWSHLQEIDPDATEIPYYAIWSEADEAGFISDIFSEQPEEEWYGGPALSGGWAVAEDPTITEEVQQLLSKATEGLLGVNYVPVAYLGSQLVAGMNYAILCQATVVYPGAQPSYVIMYLYQDLQGNVSVLNIAPFDIGSLCTYGAPEADDAAGKDAGAEAADDAGAEAGDEAVNEAGAEETGNAVPQITGNIEDGNYVLTVQLDPNDRGEWRADEMAQDNTVVKLAASGAENGVFTARYEPAGDGAIAVNLWHYNEHNVCDEYHSFDLRVEDGKVQEVTGGSYGAVPDEGDVDPYFSGEWLEKDTQFTVLDVKRKIEGGWEVEITSPISHGAWVIRATAYQDASYDAFVYADGVKYDLIPGEETAEKEAATGLWGWLKFTGTEDHLQLEWYDMNNTAGETVIFDRAPALPAYVYPGENPIEGAVANMLAAEYGERFLKLQGAVTIPCLIIHKTEMTDETHAKVYATGWVMNYAKYGSILYCLSGGEFAGIALLEKTGDEWQVLSWEEAGDGENYAADIERFAAGDKELEDQYFAASDLGTPEHEAIRTRFIREYVEANGLDITAYQDYGWDPVPLN